jgi:pimeloyl-ACP methyl ester carboxylesterase
MHYTAKAPQNVAGLFLLGPGQSAAHIPAVRQRMLDTATNARKQGIAFAAEQAAQTNFPSDDQRPVNPEHRSLLKYTVAMSDPEGYAQTCEALVGLDHKDPDYSKIKCPTVFIAGDLDTISK